jgi:hypothetical protein
MSIRTIERFKDHSYKPKVNAQRNLCGRSYFFNDSTLEWFGCRVLSAYPESEGRLLVTVYSQKKGFDDVTRVFGFAIFDLVGRVIAVSEDKFKAGAAARRAARDELSVIDVEAVTDSALAHLKRANRSDEAAAEREWKGGAA